MSNFKKILEMFTDEQTKINIDLKFNDLCFTQVTIASMGEDQVEIICKHGTYIIPIDNIGSIYIPKKVTQ